MEQEDYGLSTREKNPDDNDEVAVIGYRINERLTGDCVDVDVDQPVSTPPTVEEWDPGLAKVTADKGQGQPLYVTTHKKKLGRVNGSQRHRKELINLGQGGLTVNGSSGIASGTDPMEPLMNDSLDVDLPMSMSTAVGSVEGVFYGVKADEISDDMVESIDGGGGIDVATQTDDTDRLKTALIPVYVDLVDSDSEPEVDVEVRPEASLSSTRPPTKDSSPDLQNTCGPSLEQADHEGFIVHASESMRPHEDEFNSIVPSLNLMNLDELPDRRPSPHTIANHLPPSAALPPEKVNPESNISDLPPSDDPTHIDSGGSIVDNLLKSIAADWDDPGQVPCDKVQDIFSESEQSLPGGYLASFPEVASVDPLSPGSSSTSGCSSSSSRLKPCDDEDLDDQELEEQTEIFVQRITVTVYKCNICLRYDFVSEKQFLNHFTKVHKLLSGLKCRIKPCASDEEFDLEQKDVDRYEKLIKQKVPGRVYLESRHHKKDSEESDSSQWEDLSSDGNNADSDGSSSLESHNSVSSDSEESRDSDFVIDRKGRIRIIKPPTKSKGHSKNGGQPVKKSTSTSTQVTSKSTTTDGVQPTSTRRRRPARPKGHIRKGS